MSEFSLEEVKKIQRDKPQTDVETYLEKNSHLFDEVSEVYVAAQSVDAEDELKTGEPRWLIEKNVESKSGGYGKVMKAYDKKLSRFNAIKILHQETASKKNALAEARVLAELDHPNILKVDAIVEVKGGIGIVTEWIGPEKGLSLSDYMKLDEHRRQELRNQNEFAPPLTPSLFFQVAQELCDASDFAAQHGRAHFDMKPANVMLTKDGIKIIDFGTALGVDQSSSGTPNFMPPERHFSFVKPDEGGESVRSETKVIDEITRGEVFSVAATLASFLLGEPIFSSSTRALELVKDYDSFYEKKISPQISQALMKLGYANDRINSVQAVFKKAFHPNPAGRYKDSNSFYTDLSSLIAE